MSDPRYPNGQCDACGWGLNDDGTCPNIDCTRYTASDDVWPVLEDVLDTLDGYTTWDFKSTVPADIVAECKAMLTDYVTNRYGED
jgi:hypothetical protein